MWLMTATAIRVLTRLGRQRHQDVLFGGTLDAPLMVIAQFPPMCWPMRLAETASGPEDMRRVLR